MVGLEPSESYMYALIFELAISRGTRLHPDPHSASRLSPWPNALVSGTVYGLFPACIESIGSRALPAFTTPRSPYSLSTP